MPSFFSKLKGRDPPSKVQVKTNQTSHTQPSPQPRWEDPWSRTSVEPEEVQDLLHGCLQEIKARGLDTPFLLLPYRPTSDPSAARTFIRNFFQRHLSGDDLIHELRLTEPMALCSVMRWCWSRISGGVVGWESYKLFLAGETDSNMARYSFATFIPLSVDSEARTNIIFDFFDLLSAIAAHSKANGLGGRKLSRLAGWWAFEQMEDGNGFEGGYSKWITAADATSHLFFAYLRSLTMDSAKGLAGISQLPMSLQKLLKETDYPPESLKNMHTTTPRVLMIVESVSPTPFALLRRANHFQYRDEDKALMEFSEYIDPIEALTDECKRVLQLIASSNQSPSTHPDHFGGTTDTSWSRFEDLGFSCVFDEKEENELSFTKRYPHLSEKTIMSKNSMGRPTTPSWAEFLSSGFVDELKSMPSPLALPPDLSLPPIEALGQNSISHVTTTKESQLEPGELASIAKFYLDDSFWWVWICSLASEETPQRKAAFGRCTLIETVIPSGKWLLIEEKVKGAVSSPIEGAYIAEKKGFWGRSKRSRGKTSRKSPGKLANEGNNSLSPQNSTFSKTSLGSDTHARIQAAAARLHEQEMKETQLLSPRAAWFDDVISMKTSSVFTLQPMIMMEASPAMNWARKYDTNGLREENSTDMNSRRSSGDPLSKNKLAPSSSRFETRSHGSQPVSPIALHSPQSSMHLQISPNTSRFSTTPKFTKYQTNPSVQSSGTSTQEYRIETDQANTQSTEAIPTDSKASKNQTTFAGKSSKKSSSGSGIKRLFSRNKAHDTKVGVAPPQVTNGREALERKKTGSSIVRSLSALRKKSITPSGKPSSTVSISPTSPTPDFKSAQNSPREPVKSRSGPESEFDNLSRVSTSEVQKAQIVFSSFDQGPIEDSQAPSSFQVEDIDESVVSAVSSLTQNSVDENEIPPSEMSSEINKSILKKVSKELGQDQTQSEASSLSDTSDVETNEEETIKTRVAKIKARVAQLTGNTETNIKPALGPSAEILHS